jgi:hypothetical protein
VSPTKGVGSGVSVSVGVGEGVSVGNIVLVGSGVLVGVLVGVSVGKGVSVGVGLVMIFFLNHLLLDLVLLLHKGGLSKNYRRYFQIQVLQPFHQNTP